MSLASLLTQTVTIRRRTETGAVDDYNMPTASEAPSSVSAYVEPISATEVGPASLATHRAFFAANTQIDATDLVIVDGDAFEVVGIPGKQPNARLGTIDHIEVELTEVQD